MTFFSSTTVVSFQLSKNTPRPSLLVHLHIYSRRLFPKNKQKPSQSEPLVLKAYLVGPTSFVLYFFASF